MSICNLLQLLRYRRVSINLTLLVRVARIGTNTKIGLEQQSFKKEFRPSIFAAC
jgi:hypothetical protein